MKDYFTILNFFIDNPYEEFYLREISKKLNLSPSVTKKYLDLFKNKNYLLESKKINSRFFKLNINNNQIKFLKIAHNLKKLEEQRILKQILNKKKLVTSIVLFGSYAKGLNDNSSDIDILIIGSEESIYIEADSEVSLSTFNWNKWKKQKENNLAFYEEIIENGIILYGEMPKI